ncbi:MAG TPA: putative ABC transporter permease, partial [Candidatus Blautia stercoravium]|nr:putative ABC transporter permease [Candidatus Blautia stercoravium]
NYKGILCLESTIAWGFYTLGLFLFLHKGVERVVESYSFQTGTRLGGVLLLLFAVDFAHALYQKKKDCIPDSFQEFKEEILAFRWR